jgi:hypothetical protein
MPAPACSRRPRVPCRAACVALPARRSACAGANLVGHPLEIRLLRPAMRGLPGVALQELSFLADRPLALLGIQGAGRFRRRRRRCCVGFCRDGNRPARIKAQRRCSPNLIPHSRLLGWRSEPSRLQERRAGRPVAPTIPQRRLSTACREVTFALIAGWDVADLLFVAPAGSRLRPVNWHRSPSTLDFSHAGIGPFS